MLHEAASCASDPVEHVHRPEYPAVFLLRDGTQYIRRLRKETNCFGETHPNAEGDEGAVRTASVDVYEGAEDDGLQERKCDYSLPN
jgi:hypothetical protein